MKRLSLSVSIGLLCFFVGVLIAWEGHLILSVIPDAGIPLYYRLAGHRLSGELHVRFLRFNATEYGNYAEFQVTNGLSETAYYRGYGKNSHCSERLRRGDIVELASNCWCGTGLEEQWLRPGEEATFQVSIPDTVREFEAGFDFVIGKEHHQRTAWSGKVEVPAT